MRRLKQRRAPLLATLFAVALGAALASACGGLFETALRLDAPPQRLAAADLVVAPTEHAQLAAADGKPAQPVALSERGRLPAGVLEAVRAVAGRHPCGRRRRPRRRRGQHARSRGGEGAARGPAGDRPHRRRPRPRGAHRRRRQPAEPDPAREHLRRHGADRDGDPAGFDHRPDDRAAAPRTGAAAHDRRDAEAGPAAGRGPDDAAGDRRRGGGRAGRAGARASALRADPGRRRRPRRPRAAPGRPADRGGRARVADRRARERRARRSQGRPRTAGRGARRGRDAAGCRVPGPARAGRADGRRRGLVRCRHALHVTHERRRDRRRDRARRSARLRARRPAADRAPRRSPAGRHGAARGGPRRTGRGQRPGALAPERGAGDAGAPRRRDRAGQRLPADDAGERLPRRLPRRPEGRCRRDRADHAGGDPDRPPRRAGLAADDERGLDRAPRRSLAPDRSVAAARRRALRAQGEGRRRHAGGPARERGRAAPGNRQLGRRHDRDGARRRRPRPPARRRAARRLQPQPLDHPARPRC